MLGIRSLASGTPNPFHCGQSNQKKPRPAPFKGAVFGTPCDDNIDLSAYKFHPTKAEGEGAMTSLSGPALPPSFVAVAAQT